MSFEARFDPPSFNEHGEPYEQEYKQYCSIHLEELSDAEINEMYEQYYSCYEVEI